MSNTTHLAQQQNALLASIFTTKNIAIKATNTPATFIKTHETRGIQVYQANANHAATRSLQTAYPVIAQLVGDEAFAHLARDFWEQHPPTRGDLAQWGGELTVFITSIAGLQTEPYLSDLAKAEWALHTCATVADKAADLTSFALMTEHDPDALTLQLAPGTALIRSSYPIASLLTAHLYAAPSFAEVGQKLRQNTPEIALVWRHGLRPMVAACAAAEAIFVEQLLSGTSLLTALENIDLPSGTAPFDFQLWLPQAVQSGLLLGVRVL